MTFTLLSAWALNPGFHDQVQDPQSSIQGGEGTLQLLGETRALRREEIAVKKGRALNDKLFISPQIMEYFICSFI